MKHLGTVTLDTNRLILRRIYKEDAQEIYHGFINHKDYLYFFNKDPRTIDNDIKSLKNRDEK